jgi:hypothetical protein
MLIELSIGVLAVMAVFAAAEILSDEQKAALKRVPVRVRANRRITRRPR